ncbi:hypothetical protein [Bradyrhizobium sp. 142]|nr:hypothetical protein [Bradyrhizobium sp. 142]MCK1716016.1 hypothetical protein [Bradyrhizobium sp. 143]MCK1728039.1 hypothetical protein [Bradyrhizobium sp. 142]
METVQRLRAMALLCRQSAAYHPDKSWKLLAEADYWEHLAAAALSEQLKDGSATANELSCCLVSQFVSLRISSGG